MKNESLVVLKEVAFHLGEKDFEGKELPLLPRDELGNVKLFVNEVFSLGQSFLIFTL